MKRKGFAVILGLVALAGLCLWLRQVSPPETFAPDAARGTDAPTKQVERPSAAATVNRSLNEFARDVTGLLAETDAVRRDENLEAMLDSMAFNDFPVALQFLQRQEQTQVLHDLQVLLIRKGASTDPKTAATWAAQMPAGATRSAALAGVGVVWANQNLPEAARWASELAEGEDRENGLGHVAFEAARTKPIFALELSANLAPNDARDELVRHAVRQWAAQNPTDAAAWAGELTNPTLRGQVLADVAAAWGETDPDSAAALALKSLPAGELQDEALVQIAQRWVQQEPDRAAAWVLEFPETLQRSALENVVKLWASKDALQAEKWIESLPPGSPRDIALNALAAR